MSSRGDRSRRKGTPGGSERGIRSADPGLRSEESAYPHSFDDFIARCRDGVILIDENGRVLVWNEAEAEITGIPAADAVGAPLWELQDRLVPPEARDPAFLDLAREKILRGLAEGSGLRRDLEDEIQSVDGQRRFVHSRLFALSSGPRTFACGICRDVTAERTLAKDVRGRAARLADEVSRRNSELGRRDARLRALRAELTRAELAERNRIAEVLHDDLQQLLVASRFHLARLRDTLDHESAETGITEVLDDLLGQALEKTRSLSQELCASPHGLRRGLVHLGARMERDHGLPVVLSICDGFTLYETGLSDYLMRSARELLLNTVKHARATRARVRVRRLGPHVCLRVSDDGIGFDPASLAETAGLGLAAIKRRAEHLGGRCSVKASPGGGVVVGIVLPDPGPA